MKNHEYAALLMTKAMEDEYALSRLTDDSRISDEIVGFHAQQAIEKLLKAVLCEHGIAYRRTHDLAELLVLLKSSGITYPMDFDAAVELNPFAAELRYDSLPPELETKEPFDRTRFVRLVSQVRAWAEQHAKK